MNKNQNLYLGIGLVIALGILAVMYKFGVFGTFRGAGTVATSTTTEVTLPTGETVTVTGPGSVTITPTGDNTQASAAPDYKSPLVFSGDVSAEVRVALQTQFANVQGIIKADAHSFDGWVRLGELRKIGGDYKGAAADWEYVSKMYPKNSVSYASLGDLYMNFLKEYPKAEANYLAEIKAAPDLIDAYRNLYMLYTYNYKVGTSAAADILKLGLKNNPGNADLLALQSSLQ